MKKTALILLLSAAAFGMEAQSMYDALRFSENNYEGTARTMAMAEIKRVLVFMVSGFC